MGTQTRSESKARSFGENIESDLASRFLRVVEVAAIASAHTMGQGERKLSDQVATEAMRQIMDSNPMRGKIVFGDGERDEAPMLSSG
ncbi:MAG: fructose-bisphosphatase class II, partial [Candidatus Sulfotelmatobacter sp.]